MDSAGRVRAKRRMAIAARTLAGEKKTQATAAKTSEKTNNGLSSDWVVMVKKWVTAPGIHRKSVKDQRFIAKAVVFLRLWVEKKSG
jgi:hypothetical protein